LSVVSPLYGSSGQTITCTFTSLGGSSQRCSLAVASASGSSLEVFVGVEATTGPGGAGSVNVYGYGTANGGTNYTDGVPGTDSAVVLTSPPNVRIIGTINCPSSGSSYIGGPFPLSLAFGGTMPDHWGIVVENATGTSLAGSSCSAWYQSVQQQVV
jgi:hypothetical protein